VSKQIVILLSFLCTIGCSSTAIKKDNWTEENLIPPTCSLSQASSSGMAVIFNTRVRNNDLFGDPYLGWPLANRKQILDLLQEKNSSVVEIPDLALNKVAINPVDEEDVVESYNKIAVESGAKYLLLMHAAGGVESHGNLFQVLYLTIVGAFIFPGNEGEGQASLQAFLYKAGSTKPCFAIESGGSSSQYRPYAFFSTKKLYTDARDNAYEKFLPVLERAH
jgi:hypothetical protein